MSGSDVPPKGTVDQLREKLNEALPRLQPDVEPALVFRFEADEEEAERR